MRLPTFLEVEIGSYCNRQCAWCPNGWHDRGQAQAFMEDRVWNALLLDLSAQRYAGWFAFHNYNEPMADPHLMQRVAQARSAMPRARLTIYTNGDFLTRTNTLALEQAGVRELRITRYPPNKDAFVEPDAKEMDLYLRRLDLVGMGATVNKPRKLERRLMLGRMRILLRLPRIDSYTNRAGSVGLVQLGGTPRTRPCYLPFQAAAVDHLGNLKLCCHIYDATLAENAPYVMGNVADTPFSTLWSGATLNRARTQLAATNFKGLPACATCTHQMVPRLERWVLTHHAVARTR